MTCHAPADPIWEQKYSTGHTQRYPWDSVVSFVFRHAPRNLPRQEVSILEVGCGTGSNLWFMAREGFKATGIDASPSAIASARARMEEECLPVSLHVGNFANLPFPDQSFDLAVDRCALTCMGYSVARQAVEEIHRTLKPGGLMLFNTYSAAHGSRSTGISLGDGLIGNITRGTLVGFGQICFYSKQDVLDVLGELFEIQSCRHLQEEDDGGSAEDLHAEWRIISRKK